MIKDLRILDASKLPNSTRGFEIRMEYMHGDAAGDTEKKILIEDRATAVAVAELVDLQRGLREPTRQTLVALLELAEKEIKFEQIRLNQEHRERMLEALKRYRKTRKEADLHEDMAMDWLADYVLDYDIKYEDDYAKMTSYEIVWHDGKGNELPVEIVK